MLMIFPRIVISRIFEKNTFLDNNYFPKTNFRHFRETIIHAKIVKFVIFFFVILIKIYPISIQTTISTYKPRKLKSNFRDSRMGRKSSIGRKSRISSQNKGSNVTYFFVEGNRPWYFYISAVESKVTFFYRDCLRASLHPILKTFINGFKTTRPVFSPTNLAQKE